MADSKPKGPWIFGWATFGWVSCNIDTFVPLVKHWTLLSSLSYNQAYVQGPRFGFISSFAHQAHIALWVDDQQSPASARARSSSPLNPHYNRSSGHLPCVKSCLVGGKDKYNPLEQKYFYKLTVKIYYNKPLYLSKGVVRSPDLCTKNLQQRISDT